MFDEHTAQRLERLERGTSRRKWGCAVQRGQGDSDTDSALVPTPGDRPLLDLLDERLDRLERKNERLEWQISRLEACISFWRRASNAALLSAVVVSVGLAVFASRPRVAALLASGPPVAPRVELGHPERAQPSP